MTQKEKLERLKWLEKQLDFANYAKEDYIKAFGEKWYEAYINELLDEMNELNK